MAKHVALVVVAVAALACGCSGGDSAPTGAASTTRSTAPSTTSHSPTPCGGTGAGIVRTFCDGAATVTFDIDGTKGTIAGGTCDPGVAYLAVDAGTETNDEHRGSPPDFAGIVVPVVPGTFENGGVAITWQGRSISIADATGTHDGRHGTFRGTLLHGGTVAGSFTC